MDYLPMDRVNRKWVHWNSVHWDWVNWHRVDWGWLDKCQKLGQGDPAQNYGTRRHKVN